MDKEIKVKLIIYGLVSTLSFYFLIAVSHPGISVPIFALIQFVFLWFCVPRKKMLIGYVPIFLLCVSAFVNGTEVWNVSRIAVCILLYACMFTEVNLRDTGLGFLSKIFTIIGKAFDKFSLPFTWIKEINTGKAPAIRKILAALVYGILCCVPLVLVLSKADMVFGAKAGNILSGLESVFSVEKLFLILLSVFSGLVLFGIVCSSYDEAFHREESGASPRGDIVTINIVLGTVLIVYTAFVVVQFKYLFAGASLPYGLSYAEYARKGFFELLGLSFVNIGAILAVVYFAGNTKTKASIIAKILCCYLCLVTAILLISSFYRLNLYTRSYGLTRLRLYVMGFLFFEAIGLMATFVYIIKPRFNIVIIYTAIALTYYIVLNLTPTDLIIAGSHTKNYTQKGTPIPKYVFSELSTDAAPAMKTLYTQTDDAVVRKSIEKYFERCTSSLEDAGWQAYNLSDQRCISIYNSLYK